MTRATPSRTAVTRPGRAVGRTTRRTVCHCVVPRASEASRRPFGTRRSTTSAVVQTTGIMLTHSASEAAKPLRSWPNFKISIE